MKHSPLERYDILSLSMSAVKRAYNMFPLPPQRFKLLGFAAQFTHDAEFAAAGMKIIPSAGTELFDRKLITGPGENDYFLQDDKIATWYDKHFCVKIGPSKYHYMSNDEVMRWNREIKENDRDVILHSFEFTDAHHTRMQYMGAISWWRARSFARQNQDDGQWNLQREAAYKHNLL